DDLPSGVTFVSASNGGSESGGVVTWPTVPNLSNGASVTRTVTVTAPSSGTLLNIGSASATTADPTPGNNDGSAAASRVTTTVTAPASGTLVNVGSASGSTADPTLANNNGSAAASRVTTTVTEQADLAVTKSGPATVNPLGSITYTLVVTNNGPSAAASVVVK